MSSWFDIMYLPPVKRGEPYPLFNRVSIETSSRCNRRCSFCPVSLGSRDHPQRFIDDALFKSLVKQLKALDEVHHNLKCVEAFRLNEPLLDVKYPSRLWDLRHALPRTTLYCATNGDVLCVGHDMARAVDKLRELKASGLNVMSIDVYDGPTAEEDLKFFRRLVSEGPCEWTDHRYRAHPVNQLYVTVTDMRESTRALKRRVTESWTNCGMHEIEPPARRCPRPMRHFVVLHDGTVPVCCVVDPGDESIPRLGDLRYNDVLEIWNSGRAHDYRAHLQDKRRVLPGCDNCDARVAYAHVVRRVEP